LGSQVADFLWARLATAAEGGGPTGTEPAERVVGVRTQPASAH